MSSDKNEQQFEMCLKFEMSEIAKVWVWVSFPHSSFAVVRAAMCLGDTIKLQGELAGSI